MSNNQNNPQEVPQVKSVEGKMTDIIRRIPVNQANFDYISKRQHGINGSLAQDIKSAMKEYAQPLQSRIADLEQKNAELIGKTEQLEKQNSELTEALENIKKTCYDNNWLNAGQISLISGSIAEQALNSKEG